jgi:pimeloyl-ACP methyl ester carboxylesterase
MSQALADARQSEVTLADGRTLRTYEVGDPSGTLVIYHHGTPASGLLSQSWATDCEQRGIRMVGYDRAGYGGSSRNAGRTIADVADDIAAVADAAGADRFCTWGISGGGPHALACAALLGDRVIAAAALAPVAPYDAEGLEFLAGMGQDNLDEFGAATEGEGALRPYLEAQRAELMSTTPDGLSDAMSSLVPHVDRLALTGDLGQHLHSAMLRGLGHGVDGWLDDDLAFVMPWGFDPGSIDVPLLLLQGEQDLMVPFAHGQWLAAHTTSEARFLPDDGHLSLDAKVPDVHRWLLSQA